MFHPRKPVREWGRFYDPIGNLDWAWPLKEELPLNEEVSTNYSPYTKVELIFLARESMRNLFAKAWTRIDTETDSNMHERFMKEAWQDFTLIEKDFREDLISEKDFFRKVREIKITYSLGLWPTKHPLFLEAT